MKSFKEYIRLKERSYDHEERARKQISQEKRLDKKKHDRMLDRARILDTREINKKTK